MDTAAALSENTVTFLERRHQPMWIGGRPDHGSGDGGLAVLDPSSGRSLGEVPVATARDVDRAVVAARRAFDSGWRALRPDVRERHLRRFAAAIEADGAVLAELESIDNGKPIRHTRRIDTAAAARLAYTAAGWPTKIAGRTPSVSVPDHFVYTLRIPFGVAAIVIPWNYPLIHAVQKVLPALACGNTVVLKPSEKASLVPLRIAELAAEAGLPDGVLNVVTGDGATTGDALVRHPGVDKVAFTGSVATGRVVMAAAAATTKRLSLELGNKGANIVFADADLGKAVPRAFDAAFGNTGQSCVAGSRLFVHEAVADEVVGELVARAGTVRIGAALDEDTELGPIVDAIQFDRIESYVATGVAEGARVVCGGGRPEGEVYAAGWYLTPTILDDVADAAVIAREEIFGPVLTVHRFTEEDEVVRRANATPYGLASAIWTESVGRAHRVAAALETGVVWVNTFDMFDPAVPFGGLKESGFGRDNGAEVVAAYTEPKAVWVRTA